MPTRLMSPWRATLPRRRCPPARRHGRARLSHAFYTLFEQDGLTWDHAVSNEEAFRKTCADATTRSCSTTAPQISPEGQAHFREFVEAGGGLLVLHHAIISYQDSDWFRDLVGGRYLLDTIDGKRASTYLHDQDMNVRVATPHRDHARRHAEARPRRDLQGMWIAPTNTILLDDGQSDQRRPGRVGQRATSPHGSSTSRSATARSRIATRGIGRWRGNAVSG